VAKVLVIFFSCIVSCGAYAAQDPTAPLGWIKPKSSTVETVKTYPLPALQSIVCGEGTQCVAMFNDKILSQGQSVSGYLIKEITFERVTLARAGKTWQLELFNSNVKQ
jgi:MSHA biogenesis protein MshK